MSAGTGETGTTTLTLDGVPADVCYYSTTMPRKKNPIDDIIDAAGAWLGGNRGTINPQVQRVQRDLGTAAQTIDTYGTGGLGQAALLDVKNFQQGGSLPTNLAKTAAVNLAAGAVGAKAAQVAGRAVAATGVPARVANKVTGKTVIVHGTPNKLVGNELVPSYGSNAAPHDRVLFGWNPRSQNAKSSLGTSAAQYSRVSGRGPVDESIIPERNVVVAKVKTSATDLGKPGSSRDFIRSTAPAKIVSVVKSPGAPGVTHETYMKELNKALRKAGAPIKGENPFGRMGDRVERIRRQMQYRRSDRNSTA